jgi:mannose-1-phosphate guanylyltransferase
MVVTNDSYVPVVQKQLPETSPGFVIGEPVARNTAPCVAAAAAMLHKKDPESVMVVLPADHRIGNQGAVSCGAESGSECRRKPRVAGNHWH